MLGITRARRQFDGRSMAHVRLDVAGGWRVRTLFVVFHGPLPLSPINDAEIVDAGIYWRSIPIPVVDIAGSQ